MRTISQQITNINKEVDFKKKKEPIKNSAVGKYNYITEMKNSLEGLQNRFEQADLRFSNLKIVELIQSEEENLKRTKKDEKILRDLWATSAIQQQLEI